jgi:hypothetical protein
MRIEEGSQSVSDQSSIPGRSQRTGTPQVRGASANSRSSSGRRVQNHRLKRIAPGRLAKLADAPDLGSGAARRRGSSPRAAILRRRKPRVLRGFLHFVEPPTALDDLRPPKLRARMGASSRRWSVGNRGLASVNEDSSKNRPVPAGLTVVGLLASSPVDEDASAASRTSSGVLNASTLSVLSRKLGMRRRLRHDGGTHMQRVRQFRPSSHLRRGLGRIEVALMLGGLACLLLLLVPLVVWSREQARFAQCQGNLKAIGISMHTFATTDPEERFLTGAPSFELDGCPDTYGWPADMVVIGAGRADELLCPTNRIQGTEWLQQALTGDESKVPEERRAKGVCAKLSPVSTPATFQEIELRRVLVREALSLKSANTNYACSWFAARSAPTVFTKGWNGNVQVAWVQAGPYRQISLNVGGPLRRRTVDQSDIPTCFIPVLGDGAPAFGSSSTLPVPVQWARGSLPVGASLAAAFGAGPAFFRPAAKHCLPRSRQPTQRRSTRRVFLRGVLRQRSRGGTPGCPRRPMERWGRGSSPRTRAIGGPPMGKKPTC